VRIWIRREGKWKKREEGRSRSTQWRGNWNERGREEFKKYIGKVNFNGKEIEEEGMQME